MSEFHGHLTEEQLHILRTADLAAPECRGMMEHIASCSFCAGRFAGILEEDPAAPPAYLKDEILDKTGSLEMQTEKTVYQLSKRTRLLLYSLKVGFALTASLCLLFFQIHIDLTASELVRKPVSLTETMKEKGSQAGDFLKDLGIRLLNIEDQEVNNE